MFDPAAYGSFDLGPSRPPGLIADRCPSCGAAIEWSDVTYDTGAGTETRWESAEAECGCGLELRWRPDRSDRVEGRRARAIEDHQQERAGQIRLI